MTTEDKPSPLPALNTIRIRPATPQDGPAVREIVFATLRSYGIIPDPDGLDADVVAFGSNVSGTILEWVAEVKGVVVGSVMLSEADKGEAKLTKFFVDSTYRGLGIGRKLLASVMNEARTRHLTRLSLETRTAYHEAVHLYEATGWVRGPDLPPGYGPDRTYTLDIDP
ncbi:MAG TPA: GNAT family N-acetyltransferase [Ktedonobacterales bacterium]|jgi:ribosomal protein S18 acetylase RimI-like enzyme